jgi:putative transposase
MQYRKYGLIGLTRGEREDSGSRRALSPNLREVVEALALQKPPLPIAALHRQIARIAKERGEPVPNYFAVYRIVRELPADLVSLAMKDRKPTARGSSCSTDGNPIGRTQYGKRITPSLI